MRVTQRGEGLGFALEPLSQTGISGNMLGQDFDRDGSIETRVGGFVDLAHSPGTDRG